MEGRHIFDPEAETMARDELLQHVWGYSPGVVLDTRTVDNHVLRLRRKLERRPARAQHIKTVRGAGYLYEGP